MNNLYAQLMQSLMADRAPASPVPVGLQAFKTDVDVAENVGSDKLKKKPYNPYSIITPQIEENASEKAISRPSNFHREMLRDIKE